jgi:hypothetical protein
MEKLTDFRADHEPKFMIDAEWAGAEWAGAEWAGAEWAGAEWAGEEWAARRVRALGLVGVSGRRGGRAGPGG